MVAERKALREKRVRVGQLQQKAAVRRLHGLWRSLRVVSLLQEAYKTCRASDTDAAYLLY